MTQAEKIYHKISEKGHIYSYEITEQLNIMQYNARIYDLRKKLNCTCKQGKNIFCNATEHIISEHDNKFIYQNDQLKPDAAVVKEKRKMGQDVMKKWQETGNWLKGVTPRPTKDKKPFEMTDEELMAAKTKAEEVLPGMEGKPVYKKALARYEAICDELSKRESDVRKVMDALL